MKICVFGAASNEINKKYMDVVENFCSNLAERGHELVFGAGANGLMGAAARGFEKGGAKITGIIPSFFRDESIEMIYDKCDELIFTETMQDRKKTMEDMAEAFIIVPGGIGTFEEFFEVLTLKQLGRHKKPIAIYNIDHYYSGLRDFMSHCVDEGFIRHNCHKIYKFSDSEEEIIEYIEDKTPLNYTVADMKRG